MARYAVENCLLRSLLLTQALVTLRNTLNCAGPSQNVLDVSFLLPVYTGAYETEVTLCSALQYITAVISLFLAHPNARHSVLSFFFLREGVGALVVFPVPCSPFSFRGLKTFPSSLFSLVSPPRLVACLFVYFAFLLLTLAAFTRERKSF